MLRDRQKLAMIMAEFLGTALLTLVIMVVIANLGNPIFIALGAGLAIAAIYMIFGRVSGAHCNPAITLGMLTARRIPLLPAIVYIAAQLLGGMIAYGLYTYLTNQHIKPNTHFDSRILISEAAGAFVFSLGWAAAVYNRYSTGRTAFTLAGSLAVGILVASFVNNGIANPAVALGLQSWGWGTYVLGPVLGAVIGFNMYALLFAPAEELVTEELTAEVVSMADDAEETTIEAPGTAKSEATRSAPAKHRKRRR
jgi:glycerol uptake facilitator-like aquaporin